MFIPNKSRPGQKLGHVRSKTRSPGQIGSKIRSQGQILEKNYVYTSEGTVFMQSACNFARMLISIEFRPGPKLNYVWSKKRSPGQILEKPYVLSGRHKFDPALMKLYQNVYLHEVYVRYGYRLHWVKN